MERCCCIYLLQGRVYIVSHSCLCVVVDIPDGKDTTGLGETSLLLNTADSLLEDRGDLSWGGLGLSVGAGLNGVEGSWCNSSSLYTRTSVSRASEKTESSYNSSPNSSPSIEMSR